MPEVAEVALNRDWLSSRLVGKQLHSMRFHPHSRYDIYGMDPAQSALRGLVTTIRNFRVVEVGSKGKLLYIHLHAQSIPPMRGAVDRWLHINHGMSGGWKYPTFGGPWDGLGKHDAWSITTQGGQETTYYDVRKFGTLKVLNSAEHLEALNTLGADALTSCWEDLWGSFNLRASNKLRTRRDWRSIRELLLDQTIISGIGNYLIAEILYKAEIKPSAIYSKLSSIQLERLFKAIVEVANASYSAGGCTLHTWKNPEGKAGRFQEQLQVYGKTHCPLRHEILKVNVKCRNSYECPRCQR